MKQLLRYLPLTIFIVLTTYAQTEEYPAKVQPFAPAIMDNSFFIEEAYNQEPGVVQHIFNATYFTQPQQDFIYTFTQEWPLFGSDHQISVTIPYVTLNSNAIQGIGDVLINYRYQLSSEEDWAVMAPRVSICLPSGNVEKTLGSGVTGVQFNLPVSKRFSDGFITHFNAGFTVLPNVKGVDLGLREIRRDLLSYFTGMSAIWLMNARYNAMLEFLVNNFAEIADDGSVKRERLESSLVVGENGSLLSHK